LQKRLMSWPSSEQGDVGRAWYITPRGFLVKDSEPDGPSGMDRLNPGNFWFDAHRYLCSSLLRVKWNVTQKLDPWPRRV
jgi:hypothetical protein